MLNKMPGDIWRKFANLRLFYGFMYAHPGKKLLFMGDEFGQWDEWKFDQALDWQLLEKEEHWRLQKYVGGLNAAYAAEPALHEVDFEARGFEWIDFRDADSSIIAFIRHAKEPDEYIVVVCNFTPIPRQGYRIGVPEKCFYKEIMNSDSRDNWGSNMGNLGGVFSEDVPWHGKPCSVKITLPPLAALYFKPERKASTAEV
jgi:1,4-alpha-glucan branching enzyme